MNYNIKGTEVVITPELREYVEKRLVRTDKFLGGDSTAHADTELEYAKMRDGDKYRAEFTISAGGALYRADAWGGSMHAAIDLAIDGLLNELRRSKKKHLHLVRRGAGKVKDFIRGFRGRL